MSECEEKKLPSEIIQENYHKHMQKISGDCPPLDEYMVNESFFRSSVIEFLDEYMGPQEVK